MSSCESIITAISNKQNRDRFIELAYYNTSIQPKINLNIKSQIIICYKEYSNIEYILSLQHSGVNFLFIKDKSDQKYEIEKRMELINENNGELLYIFTELDDSTIVDMQNEKLGKPFNDQNQFNNRQDKYKMHKTIKECGINSNDQILFKNLDQLPETLKYDESRQPLQFKPAIGSNGKYQMIIKSQEDIITAQNSINYFDSSEQDYILEKYIEGTDTEYCINMVILNGNSYIVSFSKEYVIIKYENAIVPDKTEFIKYPNEIEQNVIEYGREVCKALKYTNGMIGINLKIDKYNQPILLEINARPNGYHLDLNPVKYQGLKGELEIWLNVIYNNFDEYKFREICNYKNQFEVSTDQDKYKLIYCSLIIHKTGYVNLEIYDKIFKLITYKEIFYDLCINKKSKYNLVHETINNYQISGVVLLYGLESEVDNDFKILRNEIEPNLTTDFLYIHNIENQEILNNNLTNKDLILNPSNNQQTTIILHNDYEQPYLYNNISCVSSKIIIPMSLLIKNDSENIESKWETSEIYLRQIRDYIKIEYENSNKVLVISVGFSYKLLLKLIDNFEYNKMIEYYQSIFNNTDTEIISEIINQYKYLYDNNQKIEYNILTLDYNQDNINNIITEFIDSKTNKAM